MALLQQPARYLGVLLLLLPAMMMLSESLPMEYCSSINTASMAANLSIYQSNGLCFDFCLAQKRSFAVLQYQSCWCSDYAPDSTTTTTTGSCNTKCPGFDQEKCGGDGLFGYLALGRAPSGTTKISGSKATSPPDSGQVTIPSPDASPGLNPSPGLVKAQSTVDTSSSSNPTPPPTTTANPKETPPTSVQTVTLDGGVIRTVTVTPTAATGSLNAAETPASPSGPNTAQVVGIVVGIIAFMILAAAAIFCVYLRRRKAREANLDDVPSQRGSSAGMMSRPGMSESGPPSWGTGEGGELGKRPTRLMPIDPRMDPFLPGGMYARSKSHESVHTLRDEQDYSRKVHQPKVLRATNPDPHVDGD